MFIWILSFVPMTATTATEGLPPVAETIISACDLDSSPLHQCVCQFFSGAGVNLLDGGPCNVHIFATLLLGEALPINEPQCLILVHVDDNGVQSGGVSQGEKAVVLWKATYLSAFSWPWNKNHPPDCWFVAYAIYNTIIILSERKSMIFLT